MNHIAIELLVAGLILCAAVTDLQSYRIPNWLTLPALVIGMGLHTYLHGSEGLIFSAKGLGVGLGMFLVIYVMGGMGAGDVKLLAAVGSFIGPGQVFVAGILAALLGGIYALCLMTSHYGCRASLGRIVDMIATWGLSRNLKAAIERSETQPKLRYGLVIGLGTVLSQAYLYFQH